MNGTLRVVRAESYRLLRGRALWVCAAFLAAVSLLRVMGAWTAERSAWAAAAQRAILEGQAPPAVPPPSNAYGPFVDGWAAGVTVGALLLLIAAGRGVAGDLTSGLLRVASTRSASRPALVAGRALVGIPLCLGVLLVTAGGALLGASLWFDFGPVIEDGYELVSQEELHAELLRVVATTGPSLLATWAFGLLVSCLAPGTVLGVGAALVLYLGFDLFKEVLGEARYWIFASFNPSFIDNSYIREVADLARGFSDAGFSEELLRQNMLLPWPEALALFILAALALRMRTL